MTTYVRLPAGPYVIQSGKRKGKSVEVMMFTDYPFLAWWLKKMEKEYVAGASNKNRAHRHVEWLLEQGENRMTVAICPQCRQVQVECFSVVHSASGEMSFGPCWTSCNSSACRHALESEAIGKPIEFFPFKFSVMGIKKFSQVYYQSALGILFRKVFGLPCGNGRVLTPRRAFEFFSHP